MKSDNDNAPANAGALRFMSVCSGIEAASVAWHPLGWEAVAFAEIDKAASAVLAHHYPDVPNLGDFTNVNTRKLGRVDVLCGGTPCQAFSIAGARASLADARGNLTLAFVGLAHELADHNGLRNVVWENVPGVLSTVDNAFGCFLGGLVGADGPFVPLERKPADGKSTRWWRWSEKDKAHAVAWPSQGMVSGPKGRAAWVIKDAQYFGLAQRRERVLVVADFGNGADPAAVLFERVGMQGNIAPSREAGEGFTHATAPSLTASGRGVERSGESRWQDPVVAVCADVIGALNSVGGHAVPGNSVQDAMAGQLVAYAPEIARCDATREGSSQDFESTTMVAQVYSMMPQNSGKDFKARPVDVAQPLMAAGPSHGNQGGDVVCVTGNVTHTLTNEGADASEDGTGRGTPIIAFSAKDYGADASYDLAPTLRAGGHTTSHANAGVMPAIAFSADVAPTLGKESYSPMKASSGQALDFAIATTSAVRRLTPRECERLQGFPDDYTRIPVRKTPKRVTRLRPDDMWEQIDGEWWLMAADGPRYKQLGNSWAVPKFRWLGKRLQRLLPPIATNDNTEDQSIAA